VRALLLRGLSLFAAQGIMSPQGFHGFVPPYSSPFRLIMQGIAVIFKKFSLNWDREDMFFALMRDKENRVASCVVCATRVDLFATGFGVEGDVVVRGSAGSARLSAWVGRGVPARL
jgi:hypothetical protein